MAHEELLARTDFFADAPPSVIRDLAAAGSELHLIRGDVLFREGDVADSLYLVVSGRVAIAIANPIDHRETVVALMDSGDLFGEMAMLDEGPRSAMARALEPSTVLAIPFDPVISAFRGDPTLLWAVTRLLAQRLRVMDEALADSVMLCPATVVAERTATCCPRTARTASSNGSNATGRRSPGFSCAHLGRAARIACGSAARSNVRATRLSTAVA